MKAENCSVSVFFSTLPSDSNVQPWRCYWSRDTLSRAEDGKFSIHFNIK
jgi:hypothetical protein